MTSTPTPSASPRPAPPTLRSTHTVATVAAAGLVLAGGLAYGGYWLVTGQYRETTEDAYVDGNIVQVSAQTVGTVTDIKADATDFVPEGQVLVALDENDARVALRRSQALLAKTVRQVSGQFASASQMRASIAIRESDLARAQHDRQSRAPLVRTGAVSAEEFRHAEESVQSAAAALSAAKQQSVGSRALVDRVTLEQHPDVVAAATQVQDAYLAERRTQLRAPVAGMVTRRNVQVGQRVSPGAPLMSIVALDQLWVSANFKESQLGNLRVGQTARLSADVYGHSVVYHGRVVGLDAGTGSAFSLMPAQNATGNWIKVVQRLPVRIALDPAELATHPLRLGLSMKVVMDRAPSGGMPLAIGSAALRPSYVTHVFRDEDKGADEMVRAIIRANSTPAS